MAAQPDSPAEQRRFLVISFRVGTRENGYLVGPVLVSTRDYRHFHYWDEPGIAMLEADDYEVLKVYPLGLLYGEVALLFLKDFPPATARPGHSAGWMGSDGTFFSAEGWAGNNQQLIAAA